MRKELPAGLTKKQQELVVRKMNASSINARNGWKKSAAYKNKMYIATIPTVALLLQTASFEGDLSMTKLLPVISFACAACFAWMWALEQPIIVPVSIFNNLNDE